MNSVYNKITLYYFSGTGNAKNTSGWFADEADRFGIPCEIFNIEELSHQEIPVFDENSLVGFIAPTHGFHFPGIMKKFIKRFPESSHLNAFVINTRAGTRIGTFVVCGLSGVVHYWSSLVLMRKGLKIVGLFPVDLPSNWISIHPAIKEKGTELIYKKVEPKVRSFAKTIISGGRNYKALSIFNLIPDVLIAPVSLAYTFIGKYFFAKSFIVSSRCNHCGLCEKNCPVQAIKEIKGRKFWTLKCESCMRCMNTCPQKAIETAHGFLLLSWILTSWGVSFLAMQLIKSSVFENALWLQNEQILLWIKLIIVCPAFIIGYRIMHWLMHFKIFERFFVLTSLTKRKFWGRYNAFH